MLTYNHQFSDIACSSSRPARGERGRERRERVFLQVSPHSAAAEAFVTNDGIRERKKSVEGRKGAKAKVKSDGMYG